MAADRGHMQRSVLRGLAMFRWLAWVWMAIVVYLARGGLDRPGAAVGLVVAALAVTAWTTAELRRAAPTRLTSPAAVGAEVGTATAIQLADGWVYRVGHVFSAEQSLGGPWPLAAVLSSGVAFGPAVGAITGTVMGVGRAVSSTTAVVQPADAEVWLAGLTAVQVLSLGSTTVIYAVAGGIAGYAMRLIRQAETRVTDAERRVAQARAREDVARRLHDGVLQTLAIVERRADDPALAKLAREQERDLRAYVLGSPATPVVGAGALGDALRAAAGRFETAFGGRVEVLVPDDLPHLDRETLDALAGAVGESLTNAGRHAQANHVVVYVEPTDAGVFVSVRDDGRGFEAHAVTEGVGLARSIRGRIAEAGGDVEVVSSPGRGTEVRLRVPGGDPPDG